jgi:hypothetical protein
MIQIQSRKQFKNAAARAQKERMHVSRYESGVYQIVNRAKGHTYLVRFERRNGSVFGICTCEAGMPSAGRNRVPMVCKHLFAAVIFHNAVNAMRRAASAPSAPLAVFLDLDDPDCNERYW